MRVGKRTLDEATGAAATAEAAAEDNNDDNSNSNDNENNNHMDTEESMDVTPATPPSRTRTTTEQAAAAAGATEDNNNNNDNDSDMVMVNENNDDGNTVESMDVTTTATTAATTVTEEAADADADADDAPAATICAEKALSDQNWSKDVTKEQRELIVNEILSKFKLFSAQPDKMETGLYGTFHSLFLFRGRKPPAWLNEDNCSKLVQSFLKNMKEEGQIPTQTNHNAARIAALDFQIAELPLSHDCDLEAFIKQVRATKQDWEVINKTANTTTNREGLYDAPYFCFIQSSGMGKTKIMYEAVKKLNNTNSSSSDEWWKCALVIPHQLMSDAPNKGDNQVFAHEMAFPRFQVNSSRSMSAHTKECFESLDKLLQRVVAPPKETSPSPKKNGQGYSVLLCFDEAHVYVKKENWLEEKQEKTAKAYLFRVIRMWLRFRKHTFTVVAVFAGTYASIANFRFEDDTQILPENDCTSRGWHQVDKMYEKGTRFFPVFTNTTTIGCLAEESGRQDDSPDNYRRTIPYGRPLFAMLDKKGKLDDEAVMTSILGRMLQTANSVDWRTNPASLFSVLATRVQMGQTSYQIASQLVATGYANLLGVSEKQARITYMPDPVCARLAMGMMQDSFQLDRFKGIGDQFWAKQLATLFRGGLCVPEKGDAGEIFVALYFLLCGDSLRPEDSFTIKLDEWIGLLKSGGPIEPSAVNNSSASRKSPRVKAGQNAKIAGEVSINFIQVCRNNLRTFGWDWAGLKNQSFLGYLFNSAIAFYVYPGCPLIDFVAPIKIKRPDLDPIYVPLLVSIKARDYFSPAQAENECEAMKREATKAELDTALCLLVVFGSSVKSIDVDPFALNEDSIAQALLRNEVVAKVLRIPTDDKFDLSKEFLAVISPGIETGELLASHAFIRAFNGDEGFDSKKALRAKASSDAIEMLESLKKHLRRKVPAESTPNPL